MSNGRPLVEERTKPAWTPLCALILRDMSGRHHDQAIADELERRTGMRFDAETVARYRRCAGWPPCYRNDWTPPGLGRW